MRKILIGVLVFACSESAWGAQELSTFVYPSEDELEEAFYSGEIDFIQLVTLQEIIRFGIDSSQLYLLDEIPNLSYFTGTGAAVETPIIVEQESPFLEEKSLLRTVNGLFGHSYSRRLENDGDSRYRGWGQINIGENVRTAFRLHKEYSGRERFVYRNMAYKPNNSIVRQFTAGNYTTRLGLGTIVGYRGKLLDFSDEIEGESLVYPDYGGYNGLDIKLQDSHVDAELMYSQNRDAIHSIKTAAGKIGKPNRRFTPAIIVALTSLKDRASDNSIEDFKYGLNLQTKYKGGYNRMEISAQAGDRNSFGAAVTEGRHLFKQSEINYALWHYDDEYLDLTGGSKAAAIRKTVYLPEVDFSYSDKRSGQIGGLLKTKVELSESIDFINSLIYANTDKDNYNFEFLSALEKKLSTNWKLRLDHVSRNHNRMPASSQTEDTFRRSRVELRFINPEIYVRTYAAHQSRTDEDDYVSFFSNCRYKSREFGETSLWLNVAEINIESGRVDYWYGFLENRQSLFENVSTLVKFTHSYRNGRTGEHQSTFSIGLEAAI